MKKLICVILTALFIFGMLPFSAFAGEIKPSNEGTSGNYTYVASDGLATITKVNTSISGDVVIPSTFRSGLYKVVAIGDYAFEGCKNFAEKHVSKHAKYAD